MNYVLIPSDFSNFCFLTLKPLMKDHQHDVSFLIKLAAFQASGGADT
jgi:hypothetical protein